MGEIDRSAAARSFQDALRQFQDSLESDSLSADPTAQTPGERIPVSFLPLKKSHREKQLAAIEAAIVDLEAFLNTHPSPASPSPVPPSPFTPSSFTQNPDDRLADQSE